MILATEHKTEKLERHREHQKYFCNDGAHVPGVTTILSSTLPKPALVAWAYKCGTQGIDYKTVSSNAADIGTIAHFMAECYLRGINPDLTDYTDEEIKAAEPSFLKFLQFAESEKLTPIETECQLVSEDYRYGGTLDAICRDKEGRLCLVDLKTSKAIYTPDYIMQLAAYESLWNEQTFTPIDHGNIQRRCIVRIGKEEQGEFEAKWITDISSYWKAFLCCLNLYNALKKIK